MFILTCGNGHCHVSLLATPRRLTSFQDSLTQAAQRTSSFLARVTLVCTATARARAALQNAERVAACHDDKLNIDDHPADIQRSPRPAETALAPSPVVEDWQLYRFLYSIGSRYTCHSWW